MSMPLKFYNLIITLYIFFKHYFSFNCVCITAAPFFPFQSFPGGADGKESACSVGDSGSVPRSGRSLGGGHANPLQCSCLENPRDRRAWQATVHGLQRVGHDWVISLYFLNLYIFAPLFFAFYFPFEMCLHIFSSCYRFVIVFLLFSSFIALFLREFWSPLSLWAQIYILLQLDINSYISNKSVSFIVSFKLLSYILSIYYGLDTVGSSRFIVAMKTEILPLSD